jgi:hypothetical protein
MQALRLPLAAAVLPVLGDEPLSEAFEESAGLEHPAKSSDAAPTAAAILKA